MADEQVDIKVTGEYLTNFRIICIADWTNRQVGVGGATGLAKRYIYGAPDPFAVLSVDDTQSHTTKTVKRTLNPEWDERFNV